MSATFNVLKTPLEIFEAVTKVFPEAQVSADVDAADHILVTAKISDERSLVFPHAVDARALSSLLTALFLETIGRECVKKVPCPIDERQYSIAASLNDWQAFRRVMYEKNGSSCSDAIVQFLREPNEEALHVLLSLGLGPKQMVGEAMLEHGIAYFRGVLEKICPLPQIEGQRLVMALKEHFPLIFHRLFRERGGARSLTEEAQESDLYHEVLHHLQERIVGQDVATELLAASVASQEAQEGNSAFLFIGPTGVGKTETATVVSQRKSGLVVFHMEHYEDEHDIWRLFGSASGYLGSNDKPHFAKELEPYASRTEVNGHYEVRNVVLLFDEIEKAHRAVKNSLLTLIGSGACTITYTSRGGNRTEIYDFKSCIFVCTSNLFQEYVTQCFQQKLPSETISNGFCDLNRIAHDPHTCSPEFLGRFEIVPFGPIPMGSCYQKLLRTKLTKFIPELTNELGCKEIVIEQEPAVLQALERKLYGEGVGIHKVLHYFDKIRAVIYSEKPKWGKIEDVKIAITVSKANQLIISVSLLDPQFAVYYEGFQLPLP